MESLASYGSDDEYDDSNEDKKQVFISVEKLKFLKSFMCVLRALLKIVHIFS